MLYLLRRNCNSNSNCNGNLDRNHLRHRPGRRHDRSPLRRRSRRGRLAALLLCTAVLATAGAAFGKPAPGTWRPFGPGGAGLAVSLLAVDPGASGALYAVAGGELYGSTDGAAAWRALGPALPAVSALAVGATSPPTLYAATPAALYRSADGLHWTAILATPLLGAACAVAPTRPATVYASNGGEVEMSRDGGATWSTVFVAPSAIRQLVIPAADARTVYALDAADVYKSADGGITWAPSFQLGLAVDHLDLAVAPSRPAVVYLTDGLQLFRSSDAGASWTLTAGNLAVVSLVVDPAAPQTLYAIDTQGLASLSTDGGDSWSHLRPAVPAATFSVFAVDPGTRTLYGATQADGVLRLAAGRKQWTGGPQPGLRLGEVLALVFDPADAHRQYLVTPGSLWSSADSGRSWNLASGALPLHGSIFYGLAVDPDDSRTLYAATGAVWKSADLGQTWESLAPLPRASCGAFDVLAAPGGALYAAGCGAYLSRDGGRSWHNLIPPVDSAADPANPFGQDVDRRIVLTEDPAQPTTLYASIVENPGLPQTAPLAYVQRSQDAGATWTTIAPGTLLAIGPRAAPTLYVDRGQGVVQASDDGGRHWRTLALRGLDAAPATLLVDPLTPTTLYASTATLAVVRSTDGGGTWTLFDAGLPVETSPVDAVTVLAADPAVPHRIYAMPQNQDAGLFVADFAALP